MRVYITGNFGYTKYDEAFKILNQFVPYEDFDVRIFVDGQNNSTIGKLYSEHIHCPVENYNTPEEVISKLKSNNTDNNYSNEYGYAVIFWDGNEKIMRQTIESLREKNIEVYVILTEWNQVEQGYDGSWHFGYRYYLVTPINL